MPTHNPASARRAPRTSTGVAGLQPTGQQSDGTYEFYVLWLTGSGVPPKRLGFTPQVDATGGFTVTGFLDGVPRGSKPAVTLPRVTKAQLARYNTVLITRERLTSPTELPAAPGTPALSGQINYVK